MKIGEVVKQLDIPASTIRYYEHIGLLGRQPRVGGKRSFSDKALNCLRFIKLAQSIGFSIEEIKTLLPLYLDSNGTPSSDWKTFAEKKRSQIRQKIKRLEQMERMLTMAANCHCANTQKCINATEKLHGP